MIVIRYIFHRYSLLFHPSLRSSFTLCTVFSLFYIQTFLSCLGVHVAHILARTSATTAKSSLARVPRNYGCFIRRHVIRLSDDLPLLTGGRRGPLLSPRKGLLPTTDRNICPPDFARVILFHGLSFSHLPPFNQQPRGLYSLFILTILFPCAQDCDHGAQSVSVSLPRNWVFLGRTVTFYAIL